MNSKILEFTMKISKFWNKGTADVDASWIHWWKIPFPWLPLLLSHSGTDMQASSTVNGFSFFWKWKHYHVQLLFQIKLLLPPVSRVRWNSFSWWKIHHLLENKDNPNRLSKPRIRASMNLSNNLQRLPAYFYVACPNSRSK